MMMQLFYIIFQNSLLVNTEKTVIYMHMNYHKIPMIFLRFFHNFENSLKIEETHRLNKKMTYFQIVNAFLIVYGYKYDYKNKKWIKS